MSGPHTQWPNDLTLETGLHSVILSIYVGRGREHLSDYVTVVRKGKLQQPKRQGWLVVPSSSKNSDLLSLLAANLINGVWK